MSIAPQLYARVHRGTPGDVSLYRRMAGTATDILELGCGHGRIVVPLARAGHRVTGLDRDDALLALAHRAVARLPTAMRQRVRLLRDDMRSFRLPARFERIFIPYNGLYCLASYAEQLACLRSAAAHLAPGGKLVFDAYAIDAYHAEADPDGSEHGDAEAVATVTWRGATYDVFETSHWIREAQRFQVHYRYCRRGGEASVEDHIAHRYLLSGEIAPLCAEANLRLAALYGGFDGEALTPHSEHMVCVAERAFA